MIAAVIGAGGFVGRTVVEELLERGREVVAIDRHAHALEKSSDRGGALRRIQADIQDRDALVPLLSGVDEIYHFAAQLGTSELEEDLRRSLQINVLGALNVFEAAIRAGVPR